jgi:hypothetical protein
MKNKKLINQLHLIATPRSTFTNHFRATKEVRLKSAHLFKD